MTDISFSDISIVSCGTLNLELNHLKKEGFLDAKKIYYTKPGLHQDCHELERQLIQRINMAKEKAGKVIVVYGGKFCYVNVDKPTRTMKKIIEEQRFQMSGLTDADQAVEIGRLLNVQKIMIGTVTMLGTTHIINTRIVDVRSGLVVLAEAIESRGGEEKLPGAQVVALGSDARDEGGKEGTCRLAIPHQGREEPAHRDDRSERPPIAGVIVVEEGRAHPGAPHEATAVVDPHAAAPHPAQCGQALVQAEPSPGQQLLGAISGHPDIEGQRVVAAAAEMKEMGQKISFK